MANKRKRREKKKRIILPEDLERKVFGILIFLVGVIFILSFFEEAGKGGQVIKSSLSFLLGRAAVLVPLTFFFYPFLFLKRKKLIRFNDFTIALAFLSFILLVSGLFVILDLQEKGKIDGGKLGYFIAFLPLKLFGSLATQIIFSTLIFIDILIFSQIIKSLLPEREEIPEPERLLKRPEPVFKPTPIKRLKKRLERERGVPVEIEKPITKPISLEYKSPPLNLLETDKGGPTAGDIRGNSEIIKQTLENFGIGVRMGKINVGPTVAQYTLAPAPGIKLSRITALGNNLALALAAHPIRIEAPIPGKSLVGIEVPNKKRAFIRLRSLIGDPQFQDSPSPLTFVLGRDVSGKSIFADLTGMPHLLVAGSTGAGKTVCLNSIIMSFLYQNSPKTLRFILVDPKRVEFTGYNGLPHLLCDVVYSAERTVGVLSWLIDEMERRFDLLSKTGAKDIAAYNALLSKRKDFEDSIIPYIILVIDELADLMAARGREVEAGIVRLAQMARAVGIHLIIATQRPSVEVLTGLIKANITSRISFQVASQVDARTILDMAGAEKLLGLGDMLFISSEVSKPKRIQGVFVSAEEIERVAKWIKKEQGELEEDELKLEIEQKIEKRREEIFYSGYDPLFEKAKKIVIQYKKGSASLLQRKLRIGYARAARLIDLLEKEGIVGPPDGSKAREVYIDEENF